MSKKESGDGACIPRRQRKDEGKQTVKVWLVEGGAMTKTEAEARVLELVFI